MADMEFIGGSRGYAATLIESAEVGTWPPREGFRLFKEDHRELAKILKAYVKASRDGSLDSDREEANELLRRQFVDWGASAEQLADVGTDFGFYYNAFRARSIEESVGGSKGYAIALIEAAEAGVWPPSEEFPNYEFRLFKRSRKELAEILEEYIEASRDGSLDSDREEANAMLRQQFVDWGAKAEWLANVRVNFGFYYNAFRTRSLKPCSGELHPDGAVVDAVRARSIEGLCGGSSGYATALIKVASAGVWPPCEGFPTHEFAPSKEDRLALTGILEAYIEASRDGSLDSDREEANELLRQQFVDWGAEPEQLANVEVDFGFYYNAFRTRSLKEC